MWLGRGLSPLGKPRTPENRGGGRWRWLAKMFGHKFWRSGNFVRTGTDLPLDLKDLFGQKFKNSPKILPKFLEITGPKLDPSKNSEFRLNGQKCSDGAPDIAVGRVKICSNGTDLPGFLGKICSDTGPDLPPNFQGSCKPRWSLYFAKVCHFIGLLSSRGSVPYRFLTVP